MGLLNLTLAQLLAVAIPLTGFLVALYFYDRSRRRIKVSTLRFWPEKPAPPVTQRHKKLQQPLSLLLQALATLLLLLALADLRFGLTDNTPRHHVVIVDASSTTAAQTEAGGRLIDAVKTQAQRYVRALPSGDRVMLIRADAMASAATGFSDNRGEILDAIAATEPGWTALDLGSALELAEGSFRLALGENRSAQGETAFIGADRVGAASVAAPTDRLRWIDAGSPAADLGIRSFSAARAADDPTRWEVSLEIWNSGSDSASAPVSFFYGGRKLGERTLTAQGFSDAGMEFRVRTEQAGRLEARIESDDALTENNEAALELPAVVRRPLNLLSARPDRLRDLLTATPNLEVRTGAGETGALTIVDGAVGGPERRVRVVYFNPADANAPLPVAERVRDAHIVSWNPSHPLGAGLRETDITLDSATVFTPQPDDVVIAEVAAGPVVVAREIAGETWVAVGFDPLDPGLANRLTAPLLFANSVRWFAPEVFQLAEYRAQSPGSVELDVAPASREEVRVDTLSGAPPAWVYDDGRVRLYSPTPTVTRVATPYAASRLALELPEAAPQRQSPPDGALLGVPAAVSASGLAGGAALWPWLSLLALAILAVDWSLYGRGPRDPAPTRPADQTFTLNDGPRERTPEEVVR